MATESSLALGKKKVGLPLDAVTGAVPVMYKLEEGPQADEILEGKKKQPKPEQVIFNRKSFPWRTVEVVPPPVVGWKPVPLQASSEGTYWLGPSKTQDTKGSSVIVHPVTASSGQLL
mmetsp:Transcript_84128/g.132840  ORF Transcript_84128/g.132840 Transcript_84128/m.132840 type:complete len:117 (+) Transcript_84128:60-410(+)